MTRDPYKYFRVEAKELLEQIGRAALDVEQPGRAEASIAAVLRAAHTLKGAARVVKERGIADHAHAIEEALAPHRTGESVPPRAVVDELLCRVDEAMVLLGSLGAPAASAEPTTSKNPQDEPQRTVRADVGEVDDVLEGLAGAHAETAQLRRSLAAIARGKQAIDRLVGARGDARAELSKIFGTLEREIATSADRIDRELAETRQIAERMRLEPVEPLFTRLERAVRDVAEAQGKRVRFEARGGGVRLDGHVLGVVERALGLVVRNAVAHGIEEPHARAAAGKAPDGSVIVEVLRRSAEVAFSCADDGNGVDLEAVRGAAVRRGLSPSETRELDAGRLLRLLLRGGLSTERVVTEVSGRGIGLDVARDAAERLGGRIDVRTTAGRGTTVEIVVPLSMSSLDALIVVADGDEIALPLYAIRRAARLASSDVTRTPGGAVVMFEDRIVPFAPLSTLLGVGAEARERSQSSAMMVIVEHQDRFAAIGVDRFLGTSNVVLRPLPTLAPATALVTGTALDPEGNPRLVLDPGGVVARASVEAREPARIEAPRKTVLVVDDSLTTRMLEQSILESAGYDVDLAASAEEGLEKALREQKHSLFLVDVEMPGMDGFAFVERVTHEPLLRHVPAILVTSRASPEDLRRGRDAGAKDYVIKGEFDQVKLLARIRELVP